MSDAQGKPSIVKKVMFSYFPNSRRPRNTGVRKRWEDKVLDDLNQCQIRNWRRQTLDRDKWRQAINKKIQYKPASNDITGIVAQYKRNAEDRRNDARNGHSLKVTEILTRTTNNDYSCPKCKKPFKPQGITNHVKGCASEWCKKNRIRVR